MQDHHDKIGVIKTEGKRSLGHQEFGEAPKKAARQGHRRVKTEIGKAPEKGEANTKMDHSID